MSQPLNVWPSRTDPASWFLFFMLMLIIAVCAAMVVLMCLNSAIPPRTSHTAPVPPRDTLTPDEACVVAALRAGAGESMLRLQDKDVYITKREGVDKNGHSI